MKIAVYCASVFGGNREYVKAARELGEWIGKSKHTLVYGGGESGLMGVVAEEVYAAGNEVIGVVPGNVEFINSRPQPYTTKLITTMDMSERKQKMVELADAFIALPGGIGTLDEISEAIVLTKISELQKPCILFNRNNFYTPLQELLKKMDQAGFLWGDHIEHVLFSDHLNEIEPFIDKYN